jgi:protein DJ-1
VKNEIVNSPAFEGAAWLYSEDRVVIGMNGKLITSRGPGTAFEWALTLVEQLRGIEVRKKIEEPMILPGL